MDNRPIGVFDSGLGGLSVWKELVTLMPEESMIYYADSGNCPYGPKPEEEITAIVNKISKFLIEKECKIIVVACNTATNAAIDHLRSSFSVPFIGMEPAIKPAAIQTRSGKVGILATEGTLNGKKFKKTATTHASHLDLMVQVGQGLVELVEEGKVETKEAETLLRTYIEPMMENQVDQLVLGCTHYPFLQPLIGEITKDSISVLNPAEAVARHTLKILREEQLCFSSNGRKPFYHFYTSGKAVKLGEFL
ncbi:glutamate racemase, partial [Xanthovirga aplysinae]|uniref:glutamate racemase n=1 Tax=Xanthovirga aplysinae TaxID=2529853 RepID=UPI0012BCB235